MNEVKLKGFVEEITKAYNESEKRFDYALKIREPILKSKKTISLSSNEENEILDKFKIGSMIYLKGRFEHSSFEKNGFNINWTWVGHTKNLKMNNAIPQTKKFTLHQQKIADSLKTLGFTDKHIKVGMRVINDKDSVEACIKKAIKQISSMDNKKAKTLKM